MSKPTDLTQKDTFASFPDVPLNLIAQQPTEKRDEARLMVLDRQSAQISHKKFYDITDYVLPGDVIVLNQVRVFPARLIGRKKTGGKVKVLLLKKVLPSQSGPNEKWLTLLTPALPEKTPVYFDGDLSAVVERKNDLGEYELTFSRSFWQDIEQLGVMPLPPYIKRMDGKNEEDFDSYQNVFAKSDTAWDQPEKKSSDFATPGAIAAPTAGLHFTKDLLTSIEAKGATVAFLTLKVGWGTFRPIKTEDYRDHDMMSEEFDIPQKTVHAIQRAKQNGGRVWGVGTTVVRTLESFGKKELCAGPGETSLYIYPGYQFQMIDVLVTNFHLKGHTPLVLAGAFAETSFLEKAYQEAVSRQYRFYSYGDGMVIF